jgi:hypothetical protein
MASSRARRYLRLVAKRRKRISVARAAAARLRRRLRWAQIALYGGMVVFVLLAVLGWSIPLVHGLIHGDRARTGVGRPLTMGAR